MLRLIVAISLALISPAAAQTMPPYPKTLKLHDNATGKPLGTITQWGNKFTVRGTDGELIGTIVVAVDGSKTFFDPDGKQVAMPAMPSLSEATK